MLRIYDRRGKSMIAQEYDGMYFPYPLIKKAIDKHLSELRNMTTREDDVLITSYPKSGTHWLLHALHMLLNDTLDYHRGDFPSPSGKIDGFPLLESVLMNELEKLKSPRLMISHLKPKYIPTDFKGKIIHLTRNPKDVAVSYYTFIRKLKHLEYEGEWDDFIPLFTRGEVIWGSLFDYIKQWKGFSDTIAPNRILYVSYEELKEDFVSSMAKVTTFLGKKEDNEFLQKIHKKCDIKAIRKSRYTTPDSDAEIYIDRTNKDENSDDLYRKGVVGDWKHWFTVEQCEMFDSMQKKTYVWQNGSC